MMDITLKSDRDGTVHNMCMGYVTKGRIRRYVIIDMFTRMKYLCDDIKTSFDAGSIFTDADAVIWRFAEKVLGWRRGGWSCGMAGNPDACVMRTGWQSCGAAEAIICRR